MFPDNKLTSVIGIGTDIIEIDRVARAIERGGERFLRRIFTAAEIEFCERRRDPYACFSARFAAKEAVGKALGVGLAGLQWLDIEIRRTEGEKPGVALHGAAARIAGERRIARVLISMSHSREYATAFAVAEGEVN